MLKGKFSLLAILFFCVSCGGDNVPAERILVRNDILDKEFNSIVIDNVMTNSGLMPFHKTLKPMQKVLLPYKNIRAMRFSRAYRDYIAIYEVSCPAKTSAPGFVLKLIDVHLNRMSGACELRRKGRSVQGKMEWE